MDVLVLAVLTEAMCLLKIVAQLVSFSALCVSHRCAMMLERRCACLLSGLCSAVSIEMNASAALSRASCACSNRHKENAPGSPMQTTALVSAVRFISISSWPRFCGRNLYPFRQSFTALAAAEVSFLSQLCRRGDSVRNAGFSHPASPEICLNGTDRRSIKNPRNKAYFLTVPFQTRFGRKETGGLLRPI